MSLQIGKAIYEILSSSTELVERLENKIYPLVADVNTTFPFIVYKRTGIVPTYVKERISIGDSLTVEVVIASDSYNSTVEIADLVRLAFEGKIGLYSGIWIDDIRMISADEDYVENTFIQTITLNITTNGKHNS